MRTICAWSGTLILLGIVHVAARAGESVKDAYAGTWKWSKFENTLRASLEKKKEGDSWTVKFEAMRGKKLHKFDATMDLESGAVTGTSTLSGATWKFKGTVKDDKLECTHFKVDKKGKEQQISAFSIKAAAAGGG